MTLRKLSTATFLIAFLVVLSGANRAYADIIDFESYSGPINFGNPPQTLTILGTSAGTVTISGGTVLTDTTGLPADETSVYGTCADITGCGDGYSQTITLTFQDPIVNFFVDLYNGQTHTDSFTASDNVGDSITTSIDANLASGLALVSFPAAGTQVTITTTDPQFDFLIDDVGFNQATPGLTPEPGTWMLLATGLAGIGALKSRLVRRHQLAAVAAKV
jgi:hypothetical protein